MVLYQSVILSNQRELKDLLPIAFYSSLYISIVPSDRSEPKDLLLVALPKNPAIIPIC
jgi:hypothetical protein